MKLSMLLALCALSFIGRSQGPAGIHFTTDLTWADVLQKAKQEHKGIFVDCFATWCGPCKLMDQDVYRLAEVGNCYNEKFVCVKLQMDTTAHDAPVVRDWYPVSAEITIKYNVGAFPTYLFFSSDGEALHREVGYQPADVFIQLARDASNPEKQYYTRLHRYDEGTLPRSEVPELASFARTTGDRSNAERIAWDYIDHYLLKLDPAALYTLPNMGFIGEFLQYSNNASAKPAFHLFYTHQPLIDSLAKSDFGRAVVDYVIMSEEIDPFFRLAGNEKDLDWKAIYKRIEQKYNREHATRTVLDEQIRWYDRQKNYPELIRSNVKHIELYGLDTAGFIARYHLNAMIWENIFEHSNDKKILRKAAAWMKSLLAVEERSEWVDTYANLLYKMGDVKEALAAERKAVNLEDQIAKRENRAPTKDIADNLAKMEKGSPTWAE